MAYTQLAQITARCSGLGGGTGLSSSGIGAGSLGSGGCGSILSGTADGLTAGAQTQHHSSSQEQCKDSLLHVLFLQT